MRQATELAGRVAGIKVNNEKKEEGSGRGEEEAGIERKTNNQVTSDYCEDRNEFTRRVDKPRSFNRGASEERRNSETKEKNE